MAYQATPAPVANPVADALELGNTVLQLETISQARLAAIGTAEIVELRDLLDAAVLKDRHFVCACNGSGAQPGRVSPRLGR